MRRHEESVIGTLIGVLDRAVSGGWPATLRLAVACAALSLPAGAALGLYVVLR